MKFRRTLRREEVMRRLEVALWSASPEGMAYMLEVAYKVDPPAEARAGAQLPQDERSGREARVEDPRQMDLF